MAAGASWRPRDVGGGDAGHERLLRPAARKAHDGDCRDGGPGSAVTLAVFTLNRGLGIPFAALPLLIPWALARAFVGNRPEASASPAQQRRRGLGALVVGTDGRVSTSKTQAVLWTIAVFFAIAFMLLWGRSVHCGHSASAACA